MSEIAELAMGIDPFDVEMRKIQLEAQVNEKDLEAALETLKRLAQLDPVNAGEYSIQQGEMHIKLRQWTDAKRAIVLVLEDTPHYWRAQELLLSIVERAGNEN